MAEQGDDRSALQSQLDELGEQLNDLRAKVGEQTGDVRDRLNPFVDQVKADWESVRRAAEQTGSATSEAVRGASDDAEASVKRLRTELSAAQADLRAEAADSMDAYRSAIGDLVSSLRQGLDELTVQIDLGRMDARDQLKAEMERAERLWGELKTRAEQAADQAGEATAELRSEIRKLVDDLRDTLRSVTDRLRSEGEAS